MNAAASGAWLTDIDDTLIPSGAVPDRGFLQRLVAFLRALRAARVLWVPVSGVTLDRLGPRLLERLPRQLLPGIRYYGGDGSLKYRHDRRSGRWRVDPGFSRLLSDAQALAILGEAEWASRARGDPAGSAAARPEAAPADAAVRLERARAELAAAGLPVGRGILDECKAALAAAGYDPAESTCYFRGGSVSWLMLGDRSAEPYREPRAAATRERLLGLARRLLDERGGLRAAGNGAVCVPFPGARGIKFVLEGNDKERALRDLMAQERLEAGRLLYVGNELFAGGNDDMLRRVEGLSLLSVGPRTDAGPGVIHGCFRQGGMETCEVQANERWMDYARRRLEAGDSWTQLLERIRTGGPAVLVAGSAG